MNLKTAKTWNLIGIVLGIIVLLVGIFFISNPPTAYYTMSPETATFGSDFYTYQYDATRDAAMNTATTANNIRELGGMLAIYNGCEFIVGGLLIILHFARNYFLENVSSSTSLPQIPNIQKNVNVTESESFAETK